MVTEACQEGLANWRFGNYTFDQTNNADNGILQNIIAASATPGVRMHFQGLDLTFNLVTGVVTNDRIAWEIDEQDDSGTLFLLWEGFFNCKATTGENAGQQGFSSSTKWIGFSQDGMKFRWTSNGAIAGSIFAGNIAVSVLSPNFAP